MKTLQVLKRKIVTTEMLCSIISRWEFKSEKVVFTNGCFDLLHQGHVDYLSKAADLGTKLVVGVNTDFSVRRLGKDKNRPLQDQDSRALIIAALNFVDLVILFDEDTPFQLIEQVKPHVLVKGSDYKIEQIVGHDLVTKRGGSVTTIEFLKGFSTSNIVAKARK